jgi:hypothetical protein
VDFGKEHLQAAGLIWMTDQLQLATFSFSFNSAAGDVFLEKG